MEVETRPNRVESLRIPNQATPEEAERELREQEIQEATSSPGRQKSGTSARGSVTDTEVTTEEESETASEDGRTPSPRELARFGKRLRDLRILRGFTMRVLADMVGVTPHYIGEIERGNVNPPSIAKVRRMAVLLREDPDLLLLLAGRVPASIYESVTQDPSVFLRQHRS